MVRVIEEPSPPSASTKRPRLKSAPANSRMSRRATPVNSLHESMPWLYCTVGTATLPHSMPVLAPHSMKWKRDTEGSRMMSSIVSTSGFFSSEASEPFHQQAVTGWVHVPPALVVALEMQAAGGDDAEQGLQRREGHRGLGRLRQAGAGAALDIGLVARRLAVAVGRHRLAEAAAVLRQFEDVGVAAFPRAPGCRPHGPAGPPERPPAAPAAAKAWRMKSRRPWRASAMTARMPGASRKFSGAFRTLGAGACTSWDKGTPDTDQRADAPVRSSLYLDIST